MPQSDEDNIERIRPIEGVSSPYTIYNAQSKTVDGIVNITGTVSVWEQRIRRCHR